MATQQNTTLEVLPRCSPLSGTAREIGLFLERAASIGSLAVTFTKFNFRSNHSYPLLHLRIRFLRERCKEVTLLRHFMQDRKLIYRFCLYDFDDKYCIADFKIFI